MELLDLQLYRAKTEHIWVQQHIQPFSILTSRWKRLNCLGKRAIFKSVIVFLIHLAWQRPPEILELKSFSDQPLCYKSERCNNFLWCYLQWFPLFKTICRSYTIFNHCSYLYTIYSSSSIIVYELLSKRTDFIKFRGLEGSCTFCQLKTQNFKFEKMSVDIEKGIGL